MLRRFASYAFGAIMALLAAGAVHADGLKVSPSSLSVAVGASAQVRVSESRGTVSVRSANPSIATAAYANQRVTVTGVAGGKTTITIADSRSSSKVEVTVSGGSTGSSLSVSPTRDRKSVV